VDNCIYLLCFTLIAAAFIGYSIALIRQKKRHALYKHENQRALIALTIVISICMMIHVFWDIVNIAEKRFVDISSRDKHDEITVFFLYLFWELIPAFVVNGFFGRISTSESVPRIETVVVTDESQPNAMNGTGNNRQEQEEKQRLLLPASSRRSMEGNSPGSLGMNPAKRGTAQLVSEDGSTPNFGYLNKQLADLAAGESAGMKPYTPPGRSSLEFNRVEHDDEDEADDTTAQP